MLLNNLDKTLVLKKINLFNILNEDKMKKIRLIILTLLLLNVIVLPQIRTLPTQDHFDYPLGNLGDTYPASGWYTTGTDNDLIVTTGNLGYTNYPMPVTGNQIQLSNSAVDDYKLQFTNAANNTIYTSFLLNVFNSTGLNNDGDVFAGIGDFNNVYASSRVWIRNGSITGTYYNLGLSKNDNEKFGFSGDLTFGQTYLVVIGYEVVAGSVNDIARLWINPDLSGLEPSATISGIGIADDTSIDAFFLRQSPGTPNAFIDALRIGTSWIEAPLPVELSTFSAVVIGSSLKLNWRTETEVNNYGFEVERCALSPEYQTWDKIGFVNGNGNSNSPKNYTFEDNGLLPGKYSYRLKQIDNDGPFEYSKTIQIDFNSPKKFELNQNYPNPFNPITTVQFSLPESGNARLTLFNSIGQEVKTLLSEYKESGTHLLNFDGSELSSGLYFYKLESGSFAQTMKMILLK